jgi:hypothetical protein
VTHPGFNRAGICRLTAADQATGLSAASNPVRVADAAMRLRPCWADLHGQSEETIGTNSIEDYFRFARDYAKVNACRHQGNDFQVTDDFWKPSTRPPEIHKPKRFVRFPAMNG